MSGNFDRFRKKNAIWTVADKKVNARFILNGFPTAKIAFADGETRMVSLVSQQEKDKAYVYTDIDSPMNIGDLFSFKGLYFLITEEIMIVKDVLFHKYLAIICNAELDE